MIKINGYKIEATIFPDKTSQVWKLPEHLINEEKIVTIEWDFENESELFHLAQLKDLINVYGNTADLFLSYLPCGRQDKLITNDSTFALRSFANIINHMNFNKVFIMDPHSRTALTFIYRSVDIYPIETFKIYKQISCTDIICYPDKGSFSKYPDIYKFDHEFIVGEKDRDESTGFIKAYNIDVKNPSQLFNKSIMIIDDICDGGATFIMLVNELKKYNPSRIDLFVTHGIFSKGIDILKDSGITSVCTKNGLVYNQY